MIVIEYKVLGSVMLMAELLVMAVIKFCGFYTKEIGGYLPLFLEKKNVMLL